MIPVVVGNDSQFGEKPAHLSILIVDDEPLILWSLREALRARSHEVATASTGAEALRTLIAQPRHFHVIVLDYRLPDRHDLSLLADVQSISPNSAVLMMTAFADDDMCARALARGVRSVVAKPFQLKSFVSLIESAVTS